MRSLQKSYEVVDMKNSQEDDFSEESDDEDEFEEPDYDDID